MSLGTLGFGITAFDSELDAVLDRAYAKAVAFRSRVQEVLKLRITGDDSGPANFGQTPGQRAASGPNYGWRVRDDPAGSLAGINLRHAAVSGSSAPADVLAQLAAPANTAWRSVPSAATAQVAANVAVTPRQAVVSAPSLVNAVVGAPLAPTHGPGDPLATLKTDMYVRSEMAKTRLGNIQRAQESRAVELEDFDDSEPPPDKRGRKRRGAFSSPLWRNAIGGAMAYGGISRMLQATQDIEAGRRTLRDDGPDAYLSDELSAAKARMDGGFGSAIRRGLVGSGLENLLGADFDDAGQYNAIRGAQISRSREKFNASTANKKRESEIRTELRNRTTATLGNHDEAQAAKERIGAEADAEVAGIFAEYDALKLRGTDFNNLSAEEKQRFNADSRLYTATAQPRMDAIRAEENSKTKQIDRDVGRRREQIKRHTRAIELAGDLRFGQAELSGFAADMQDELDAGRRAGTSVQTGAMVSAQIKAKATSITEEITRTAASTAGDVLRLTRQPLLAAQGDIDEERRQALQNARHGKLTDPITGAVSEFDERPGINASFDAKQALAKQRWDDQTDVLKIGLGGQSAQLQAMLAHNRIGSQSIGITTAGLEQAKELDQSGRPGEAGDSLRNTILQQNLLKQDYLESFRGAAVDLRTMDVTNSRDVENPGRALSDIAASVTRLEDAIDKLGIP